MLFEIVYSTRSEFLFETYATFGGTCVKLPKLHLIVHLWHSKKLSTCPTLQQASCDKTITPIPRGNLEVPFQLCDATNMFHSKKPYFQQARTLQKLLFPLQLSKLV